MKSIHVEYKIQVEVSLFCGGASTAEGRRTRLSQKDHENITHLDVGCLPDGSKDPIAKRLSILYSLIRCRPHPN